MASQSQNRAAHQKRVDYGKVSSRGWRLSFIGMAVALLLGGAIRVQLSSRAVLGLIEQYWIKPRADLDIQLAHAEVELADGWWPAARLKISGLRLQHRDSCQYRGQVYVDSLMIGFQVWPLISESKFKLKDLSIETLRWDHRAALCESAQGIPPTLRDFPQDLSQLASYLKHRLRRDLKKVNEGFREVRIKNLKVFQLENLLPLVNVENLLWRPDPYSSRVLVQAALLAPAGGPFVGFPGRYRAEAIADPKGVELHTQARIGEGNLAATVNWSADNLRTVAQLQLEHLPLAEWNSWWQKRAGTAFLMPRQVWLTGRVESEWQAGQERMEFKIPSYRLEGSKWLVDGQALHFESGPWRMINRPHVKIKNLPLSLVIEALGWQWLSGWFGSTIAGQIDGEWSWLQDQESMGDLRISGVDVSRSFKAVDYRQQIVLQKWQLHWLQQRLTATLGEIELSHEGVQGQARLDWSWGTESRLKWSFQFPPLTLDTRLWLPAAPIHLGRLEFYSEGEWAMASGTNSYRANFGVDSAQVYGAHLTNWNLKFERKPVQEQIPASPTPLLAIGTAESVRVPAGSLLARELGFVLLKRLAADEEFTLLNLGMRSEWQGASSASLELAATYKGSKLRAQMPAFPDSLVGKLEFLDVRLSRNQLSEWELIHDKELIVVPTELTWSRIENYFKITPSAVPGVADRRDNFVKWFSQQNF